MRQKIGLLAGAGFLPVDFARAARGMGFDIVAIGVVSVVEPLLATVCDKYYQISVGRLDKIIKTLLAEEITTVTMLGKVNKELLYKGLGLDFRAIKLLWSLPNRNDDTIMLALVEELAKEGITTMNQTEFLSFIVPPLGQLTRRAPSAQEEEDINYGFEMALAIGGLDIGQSVVVKQKATMAVEAIEGTDACIRRGGQLGGAGAVVVKTAKPRQDDRFDMPSVGLDTIRAMAEVDAAVLAIEAGRTLFTQRQEAVALADQRGIAIVVRGRNA
jgi:DUF1009 family protein